MKPKLLDEVIPPHEGTNTIDSADSTIYGGSTTADHSTTALPAAVSTTD